ncbi:hypothetical protein [Herbidospora mongoliensis]|uniref:hypothetical protein n=1 Tax=Herbidospora mongoliensis TaxID=688067 RepID=UPI0012FBD785|nr:hypothetical protein [Herbidospora mongoliensis]
MDEQYMALRAVHELLTRAGVCCYQTRTVRLVLFPGSSSLTAPLTWEAPELVAFDSTGATSATVHLAEVSGHYIVRVWGDDQGCREVTVPSVELAASHVPGYAAGAGDRPSARGRLESEGTDQ